MKSIFLSSVYSFIRLIGLTLLIGCGSVQTINGVRVKDKPPIKEAVFVGVISFGFGYYLGSEVLPQKKN